MERGCRGAIYFGVHTFIKEHRWLLSDELASMQPPKAGKAGIDWTGIYKNDRRVVHISGEGNCLAARAIYTEPGKTHAAQGSEDRMTCQVNGLEADCTTIGTYHDQEKTIDFKGTVKFSLDGNRLSMIEHITGTTCRAQKEPSCDKLGYTPAVHTGANFVDTVTRE